MKAAVIEQYGGPEVFSYRDMPDPTPAEGEVVILAAAASLNPVDALDRAGGTRDWRKLHFPAVIGWDVSGVVETLGPGVRDFSVGDRVMAWAFATYAQRVAVRADLLVRVPQGMDLADAAALPLATMTGSQLISDATAMQPGQTVLVSGALGAVGRSAVFTARDRGARVIAGVRAAQMEEARSLDTGSLGTDDVLALDDEAALAAAAKVDIVANTVRGATAARLLPLVKPGGTFASVTGAPANAGERPDVQVIAFVSKQRTGTLHYTAEAVRSGHLAIPIGHRLPLSQARRAHEMMAQGSAGKILLLP